MIQSIFAVRFANMIFENVWNRDHIDNVQITFAERLGVEERGGYYDESGALVIWYKTTHFSFFLSLPWTNQQVLPKTIFELKNQGL